MDQDLLTPRWTPLRPHDGQLAWMASPARFNVVPAGRRSGKTEKAKRKLVKRALGTIDTPWVNPRFFAAAPTRAQAKEIWWADLKRLVPKWVMATEPRETDLIIELITGASIHVIGMDKPERIEGQPWDGGVLDEYGNMKAGAWEANVLPALADRKGWCDLIGVPEGRNHYYKLNNAALADTTGLWRSFTWKSADILDPDELALFKATMDPLMYEQEFEASFVNFYGRVYYSFERASHTSTQIVYDPKLPLIFCFDFNVAPGVCSIAQEQKLPNGNIGTAVIGEVWIPNSSTTPSVCRKLIADWGQHKMGVYCYGDATGGNRGTAKLAGSDWDIIRNELRPAFGSTLRFFVRESNPPERSRVNAVNTRVRNGAGEIHLMVNPAKAPRLVEDLEGVRCLEGGSGEIDKEKDPQLTHISDALGYYIYEKFPILKGVGQRDF